MALTRRVRRTTPTVTRNLTRELHLLRMSTWHRGWSHSIVHGVESSIVLHPCLLCSELLESHFMRVDLSGVGHGLPRLAWRLTTLIDQLIDLDVEVTNSTSKICRQHNVDLQTARLHYVAERGDRGPVPFERLADDRVVGDGAVAGRLDQRQRPDGRESYRQPPAPCGGTP